MFYAKCARFAINMRKIDTSEQYNWFIGYLKNPITVMDYDFNCIDEEYEIKPLFPVGQIAVTDPYLNNDIDF